MRKVEFYRQILQTLEDWESFLLEESGLPGPRANLELVQAVADEGDETLFLHLLTFGPDEAPTSSPQEFLALCGVVGLGKLIAQGKPEILAMLRQYAADPRWRIREGVRMGLERLGQKDMGTLLGEMEVWSRGTFWEQRAAAAALCEPQLLRDKTQARRVLDILDEITASLHSAKDRRSEEFKVLRKALGYCWSVAVVALPEEGKRALEKWFAVDDRDVMWVMKENLRKKRLARLDAAWVEEWQARLRM
jgi:hypothetical protein